MALIYSNGMFYMCMLTRSPKADSLTHTQIQQYQTGLCPPPRLLLLLRFFGSCSCVARVDDHTKYMGWPSHP